MSANLCVVACHHDLSVLTADVYTLIAHGYVPCGMLSPALDDMNEVIFVQPMAHESLYEHEDGLCDDDDEDDDDRDEEDDEYAEDRALRT